MKRLNSRFWQQIFIILLIILPSPASFANESSWTSEVTSWFSSESTSVVSAETAPPVVTESPSIPAAAAAPEFDDEELADLVTVYKKKRQLQLWQNGKLLKSYRIALGFTPVGAKHAEGDGKTPEGIYMLTDHNENSRYHLSILVDYPSGGDLVYAEKHKLKPGGAIMIHGLPNDGRNVGHPKKDWTDGCIAVTNKEIREIWNRVAPNTPIMIMP